MAFWNFEKTEKDKYLSEARKCMRRGEFDRAGDNYFLAGEADEALEMYVRGGHHQLAAQMLEKKGDLRRAAEHYVQAKDLRAAANLYQKVGDVKRAGQFFEKVGEHFKAAQAEEAARSYRRAAELYLKAGHLDRAAANYAREGDHLRAAEMLEDYLKKTASAVVAGKEKDQLDRQWAQCADLFLKSRRATKAAEIWARLGQSARAAEAFEQGGDPSRAIEMLLQAQDPARAYEVYERAPDGAIDRPARAELFYARGEWKRAGDLFAELREYRRAADCFERGAEPLLAADQHQLAGDLEIAADILYGSGAYSRASKLYQQALRYLMAARAAEEAGEMERAAALYAEAHEPIDAGRCWRSLGNVDEAIRLLQGVAASDGRYAEASALLGDLFREKGLGSIAGEKYRAAIGSRGVEEANIDAYYGLAVLQEEQGETVRAIELYERIVAANFSYRDAAQRLEAMRRAQTATPAPGLPRPPAAPSASDTQMIPAEAAGPVAGLFGGRYEIVSRIGESARGELYKAWDSALRRTVVLKRLRPQSPSDDGQLHRYIDEAQQASKLHHSNVATIYDAVESPEGRLIAMEYVFGESLRELLARERKLSPAQAIEVASQMLLALEYAHGVGVTHRNLRPENVMLSEKAHVKITDFGMNRRVSDLLNDPYTATSPLHYVAPELIRREKGDGRSDIYALGCILYEMLTGQPPFLGSDVLEKHLQALPLPPSSVDAEIPAQFDRVVLRCLEKDPAGRYAAAHQVYEELRAYDFVPGMKIGDRYELKREIGTGGMGKVYLARDLELDEIIAMKILRPEFGTDTVLEQRFIREIKLARRIVHPSVVKVYDFGKWKNLKYITMEFIEGISLDEYVRRSQPPDIREVVEFTIQICEALETAHRLGVVHRDIKPQNVLLSVDGRPKIVDFGIARLDEHEDLTSSRLIIGSPKYMSPEQISGKNLDHRTDIYSLGVVLYYCVTGIEPFAADDTNATIMKQLHSIPTPPSQVSAAVPPWLEFVILKCLSKDPKGRYQSAAEVARDLAAHSR